MGVGYQVYAMEYYKLVFLAHHVGDVHVVGRGAKIFELLASEDINRNEMDLGVTVFAGLGSAHFDNFARAVLYADKSVLAERRALHRIGGGSTGIGALEGVLMLFDQAGQRESKRQSVGSCVYLMWGGGGRAL